MIQTPRKLSAFEPWQPQLREVPSWEEKEPLLFWRGARTSAQRNWLVPAMQAQEGTDVAFLEWSAPGGEKLRQDQAPQPTPFQHY